MESWLCLETGAELVCMYRVGWRRESVFTMECEKSVCLWMWGARRVCAFGSEMRAGCVSVDVRCARGVCFGRTVQVRNGKGV